MRLTIFFYVYRLVYLLCCSSCALFLFIVFSILILYQCIGFSLSILNILNNSFLIILFSQFFLPLFSSYFYYLSEFKIIFLFKNIPGFKIGSKNHDLSEDSVGRSSGLYPALGLAFSILLPKQQPTWLSLMKPKMIVGMVEKLSLIHI